MYKELYKNYKNKNISFSIGKRTPRRNEYEKGLKYFLIVNNYTTCYFFDTIKAAKQWIHDNYFIFL